MQYYTYSFAYRVGVCGVYAMNGGDPMNDDGPPDAGHHRRSAGAG